MSTAQGEKRDLVLAPGEYAYLQDETRGQIKTHCGPTQCNATAQDRFVRFDPETGSFQRCTLEQAAVKSPVASEGDYLILQNPAAKDERCEEGQAKVNPPLLVGRKINLPGPCSFALWPGQKANVVKGHHLRSNQFLIVRVYNESEAKANWSKGVVATQGDATTAPVAKAPPDLSIGQLLLIKGTEVSFYIPPTGVEVVTGDDSKYVREAVTLERLEYAVLEDEDGNKRYEKGPQVVFPQPTEQFFTKNGQRKFRAIELNGLQGIHVRVIAEYEENDQHYDVGTELFITGNESAIYYPRVEHAVIRYGEKEKHFATAIPVGEARYVLNRDTGEIITERGPKMLLPDPRNRVIVRRILSDKQCELWYPNSAAEAKLYNQTLKAMMSSAPSARSGFISEGDVFSNVSRARTRGAAKSAASSSSASARPGGLESMEQLQAFAANFPAAQRLEDMEEESDQYAVGAESFSRGTSYTPPRTVILDTKYEGVPGVTVWTGYAVLVVSKSGNRRVVQGPATILLDYDESLEVLELSTGKPKNTDALKKDVYLRTQNNKVSDIVNIVTKDRVTVSLKLSYRLNFEGDSPEKWFSVENYVKFCCDHVRSLLKGAAQKRPVSDYDSDGVDIVRDTILGKAGEGGQRQGLVFRENNMRVTDVEVLGIDVADTEIAAMLNKSQHTVVRQNIELAQAEKNLTIVKRQQEIEQEIERSKTATAKVKYNLQADALGEELALALARADAELRKTTELKAVKEAEQVNLDIVANAELARVGRKSDQELSVLQRKQEQTLATLKAECESIVARFQAATPGFTEAIAGLSNQVTLREVAEAMSVQTLVGGKNMVDAFTSMFKGTPLEAMMNAVVERQIPVATTNVPTGGGKRS